MDKETLMRRLRELEAKCDQEIITQYDEPEDEPAEEITHHTSDFACALPVLRHIILIPWYTSGFQ